MALHGREPPAGAISANKRRLIGFFQPAVVGAVIVGARPSGPKASRPQR